MADDKRSTVNVAPPAKAYDDDAFVHHFAIRGAREIIVMDSSGRPMRSTVSQRRSFAYASHLYALATMARNVVRDLDPSNDVTFLRLRSVRQEVHISINQEFIVVVIQRLKKQKE
ncbi:dynein light chain roadblock-type 1 [Drosophila innubila]|uniref:dynein light chain roadblock-type 1 n=1 Tax=Drosophila innubila TaxID=198719 RepID=UPI00148E11E5|nr:dynein light chain roadblock-type 1 [Drosophila innubila]